MDDVGVAQQIVEELRNEPEAGRDQPR